MKPKTNETTTALVPAVALVDPLMTRIDLAAVLSVRPQTLAKRDMIGAGPKITRVGRLIRYQRSDVEEWLRRHRDGNTDPADDGDTDAEDSDGKTDRTNPSDRSPARRRNSSRRD